MNPPVSLGVAIDQVRKTLRRRHRGYCYAASEAVYHLVGGAQAGYIPMKMLVSTPEGDIGHWFLQGPYGEIIDLTAGQFKTVPDYSAAQNSYFILGGHTSRFVLELLGE